MGACKDISPYFVNNPNKRSKITLVDEKGNTLSEDEKIAEIFNNFFGNIIENLNISINNEVSGGYFDDTKPNYSCYWKI